MQEHEDRGHKQDRVDVLGWIVLTHDGEEAVVDSVDGQGWEAGVRLPDGTHTVVFVSTVLAYGRPPA